MNRKKYNEDFKIQIAIIILKRYEIARNLSRLLKMNYSTIIDGLKSMNFN